MANIIPKSGGAYKDAGVDIEAGNQLARRIGQMAKRTLRPEVVSGIGGFAGLCGLPKGLDDPLLVSGTDGVGTKLKVAFAMDKHNTIGIDLVAMCANDILTVGAEPLFFLDYLATGKVDGRVGESIMEGVVAGCEQAGCALLGGETAEMPGMYQVGEYDLAGFVVGVVDRGRVIDGKRVQAGDAVIGIPSSGLHSNGYSLARKVLITENTDLNAVVPELGRSLGEAMLEPTRIYAKQVKALLGEVDVRALVHITGGGLVENPPRCTSEDLGWRLQTSSWTIPPIFELIAERGGIDALEMRRTFNMGLGLLAVVPRGEIAAALAVLADEGATQVGEITDRGDLAVEFI
jgi:phosphoribosylformylglycinamidine cyclo-ligase